MQTSITDEKYPEPKIKRTKRAYPFPFGLKNYNKKQSSFSIYYKGTNSFLMIPPFIFTNFTKYLFDP